jgi:hypothetical protein
MSFEKLGSIVANFLDTVNVSNIIKRCFNKGLIPSKLELSDKLTVGDHLFITYGVLTHHGIYSGDGQVIHYKKGCSNGIMDVPLREFAKGVITAGALSKKPYLKNHDKREFSRDESITRARSSIGEASWHLLNNNCEHFVERCINGKYEPDATSRHAVNDKKPAATSSKISLNEKLASIIDNSDMMKLFIDNSPRFNINFITLGGLHCWNDVCSHAGWRLQQHKETLHMRLLDPGIKVERGERKRRWLD